MGEGWEFMGLSVGGRGGEFRGGASGGCGRDLRMAGYAYPYPPFSIELLRLPKEQVYGVEPESEIGRCEDRKKRSRPRTLMGESVALLQADRKTCFANDQIAVWAGTGSARAARRERLQLRLMPRV